MNSRIRAFRKLARNTMPGPGIGYLILFVTSRCNARCRMCFNRREEGAAGIDLPLADIVRLAKSEHSLFQLIISGGEPFLRDDITEIAAAFRRHSHVSVLSIPTNGSLPEKIELDAAKICRRLGDVIVRINVSIDGMGPTHDLIRGAEGLYERAAETAGRLIALKKKYRNLSVNVQTVLTTYNAGEIEELFRKVDREIGPDFHSLGWPRGNLCEPEAGNLDFKVYEKLLTSIRGSRRQPRGVPVFTRFAPAVESVIIDVVSLGARRGKWPFPCVAGRKMLVVKENCDVLPCEMLGVQIKDKSLPAGRELKTDVMGNLCDADFNLDAVLKSPEARKIKSFIAEGRCPCTFDCAIYASMVFNPVIYPMIVRRALSR